MNASITRLHITPLNQDLLTTVLGSKASKLATNISYHSLQTFPENTYGYVDLPQMEADRVKKRINGAILKGKKIQIEEARPKKRKLIDEKSEDLSQVGGSLNAAARAEKKSKKERNVVAGHELSPERKVKRGWTENKSERLQRKRENINQTTKPQASSKYTDKDELLFRTKIPKNKSVDPDRSTGRKAKAEAGTEIVHEFAKSTTVPSFLRQDVSHTKNAVGYEDGQGWVDNDGQLVEKENLKASRRRKAARNGVENEVVRKGQDVTLRPRRIAPDLSHSENNGDSSTTSSSSGGSSGGEEDTGDLSQNSTSRLEFDDTSSSGTDTTESLSEASSDVTEDHEQRESSTPIEDPNTEAAVHPLEALFKKPAKPASSQHMSSSQDLVKPSLEVQTSFSFFESHDDIDEGLPPMPMTPFSSQDLHWREIRSAAPTPDTANPSRMNSVFNEEGSDDELSEAGDNSVSNVFTSGGQQPSGSQNLQIPETDFEKQFWEKRGENNRAWKARRRAVLKEKRQRENRARRPKNW